MYVCMYVYVCMLCFCEERLGDALEGLEEYVLHVLNGVCVCSCVNVRSVYVCVRV